MAIPPRVARRQNRPGSGQWHQLMGGLGPADAERQLPAGPAVLLCPFRAAGQRRQSLVSYVLIVGRTASCASGPGWSGPLRQLPDFA